MSVFFFMNEAGERSAQSDLKSRIVFCGLHHLLEFPYLSMAVASIQTGRQSTSTKIKRQPYHYNNGRMERESVLRNLLPVLVLEGSRGAFCAKHITYTTEVFYSSSISGAVLVQ